MKKFLTAVLCLIVAFTASAKDDFLKGKVLKLDKGCSISERGGGSLQISLSGVGKGSSLSVLDVSRALIKARSDNNIAMVYIDLDHVSAGLTGLEELRQALKIFSGSGKPIVAYASSLGDNSYYLGTAADKIFMYPEGQGTLTGAASAQVFLKDLLDTLGIDVQLIRHGKFKSAGEMYIRNDISPENRLQYEEMLSSRWGHCVKEIAASRGVSADSIKTWTDGLALSSAKSWLEKGLVDGLKYRDEMEQYICHLFGTRYPRNVESIGIAKYVENLKKPSKSKNVAVIYADGEIARSGNDIVGESMARTIAKVRADSSVKAVVFRVNSPGGEVVASDMIRREMELLCKEKPVVASYGSYAASGGYLISAGCPTIITNNTTLTGSIGVFGLVMTYGNALRKHLHINPVVIGTNEHSGMSSGFYPLTEEEQAWYQQSIEHIYDTFVGVVSEGRGIDKARVDSLAQGRVWTGAEAVRLGLADRTGTLADAIMQAAEDAGLKSYGIKEFPAKKSFKEELFGKDSGKDDLIRWKEMFHPGFTAMARIPYMINEQNY